jgi:hypothetical protein
MEGAVFAYSTLAVRRAHPGRARICGSVRAGQDHRRCPQGRAHFGELKRGQLRPGSYGPGVRRVRLETQDPLRRILGGCGPLREEEPQQEDVPRRFHSRTPRPRMQRVRVVPGRLPRQPDTRALLPQGREIALPAPVAK